MGQVAKRQAVTNPENTVFSIKRFMGRSFDEVYEEMKMVPYRVVQDGDRVVVRVAAEGDKDVPPPEISAMVLQKLKQAAEDYLGQPVSKRSLPCRLTLTMPRGRRQRTRADRRPERAAHR